MHPITSEEMYKLTKSVYTEKPALHRLGQHAFNTLWSIRRDIALAIQHEENCDPFYDDSKMDAFWNAVMKYAK